MKITAHFVTKWYVATIDKKTQPQTLSQTGSKIPIEQQNTNFQISKRTRLNDEFFTYILSRVDLVAGWPEFLTEWGRINPFFFNPDQSWHHVSRVMSSVYQTKNKTNYPVQSKTPNIG